MYFARFTKSFRYNEQRISPAQIGDYGACLYWFISYLSERNQCVSINGNVSKPLLIDCGVPQIPILGLLFFITHVNDFPNSCKTIIAFYFR